MVLRGANYKFQRLQTYGCKSSSFMPTSSAIFEASRFGPALTGGRYRVDSGFHCVSCDRVRGKNAMVVETKSAIEEKNPARCRPHLPEREAADALHAQHTFNRSQ